MVITIEYPDKTVEATGIKELAPGMKTIIHELTERWHTNAIHFTKCSEEDMLETIDMIVNPRKHEVTYDILSFLSTTAIVFADTIGNDWTVIVTMDEKEEKGFDIILRTPTKTCYVATPAEDP